MSDLYYDNSWNCEASRVSQKLDHNDVNGAHESMRRDIYQLQNDPRAQQEFIDMVNRYDQKGVGADLNVFRDNYGREQWQISAPNYGDGRNPYPQQYPYPQGQPPEYPRPRPYPVPVRPDPGTAIIDGVAAGAGIAIGSAILGGIFNGHRRR